MKIVKWSFGDYNRDSYIEAKDLIIGKNILLSNGKYKGLQFSINGLGLNKYEREVFNCKFLKRQNILNIYFGKLIITHDKSGYKNHLSRVKTEWEMELSKYIKHYFKYTIKPKLEKKFDNTISKLAKLILFNKKEVFEVQRYYEKAKIIKCDRLTAFQLASNYEADLLQNGRYLLSPLGLEWEENNNLIVKHLGKLFKNFKLYGYADWSDVEILK